MSLPISPCRFVARPVKQVPSRALGLAPTSSGRGKLLVAHNASDDLPMMSLTAEEARGILGVTSTSSFDEVLQKKNQMISQAGQDQERVMQLEAAYDTVFMESMKARLSGQTNVSTSVRYADVPPEPPRRGPQSSQASRLAYLPVGHQGGYFMIPGDVPLSGSNRSVVVNASVQYSPPV